MFNIASLVESGAKFSGGRVAVVTNGGGFGVVCADKISIAENLELANFSKKTLEMLRARMPARVNIRNPLDIVGDATTERYKLALDACLADDNVDAVLLLVLYQTPMITADVVEVISEARAKTKKPIVVVSTGAEFTETLSRALETEGLPVFNYPEDAISAMDKLVWYERARKT
ncbi:hypothetical protein D6817_03050 [Candidatus Pacearchaeota archaeon]|nr:MAG: hypothetical protein D6817_03050 [Candidatus Pacearchaeota archaeon]